MKRELYIDNIRVCLTALVILHHTAITYGGPGSWYFKEDIQSGVIESLVLTIFVATNQAFFMGLFFFLSSYFISASLVKKGGPRFMADRFVRLGIPMVFYSLVISPCTIYIMLVVDRHLPISFIDYYTHQEQWINIGVLWFTCALLLFTTVFYFLDRWVPRPVKIDAPGDGSLFNIAIALGFVSFLVRIFFPIGWTLSPVGFQFAHFPQYIIMFTAGIFAYRNDWLSYLNYRRGKFWIGIALLIIVLGFPGIYLLKIVTHSGFDVFMGGVSIQSFVNSMWEQLLGLSLIVGVIALFKQKWNDQSRFMREMSRSAYAVYIIHPFILVFIALLFKETVMAATTKFLITGSLSVVLSFGFGFLLTRVPLINKVI